MIIVNNAFRLFDFYLFLIGYSLSFSSLIISMNFVGDAKRIPFICPFKF